jgi:hypothetical protein
MFVSAKKILIFVLILIACGAVLFFIVSRRSETVLLGGAVISEDPSLSLAASMEPTATPTPLPKNPITGEECANALRRPMAVMLSGDAIARPLSGISEADMVFEMPVITGSITRFMAVFICRDPIEIGSVRSARHDFVYLAKSLDAMYAHWGGSHFALDLLKQHTVDNIDALPNPTGAYWRKDSAPAPHNGFTSMTRLLKAAKFLQYRLEGKAPAYPHVGDEAATVSSSVATSVKAQAGKTISSTSVPANSFDIGYAGEFRVRYEYDASKQAYLRLRGGIAERDKNSGSSIYVKNVVVMRAESKQIEGQYNDVTLEGEGEAVLYRGGVEFMGKWSREKNNPSAKLTFLDMDNNEMKFDKGNIWVEIVEPYTKVDEGEGGDALPQQ